MDNMRRVLAIISACGLAISIGGYMKSLSGATNDDFRHWIAGLVVGALALSIPIPFVEHAWGDRTFFWKGFARGMPRWAVPCISLVWLIAVAHLVWFFLRSDAAIPIIRDGQYLLENHGRIRRVLTEAEYLTLKADEFRTDAAFTIACFMLPMFYWWFPRKRTPVVRPPLPS